MFMKSSEGTKMRKVKNPQMQIGEVDISQIEFDPRSRDEIPKLLKGLQYIYCVPELRNEIFSILEEMIPENIEKNNGRKGMELWKILIFGTLRLNCNWDYDKVHEMANNHIKLREMLGHGWLDKNYYYPLQTLKDNVSLFTPEILEKLNYVVVKTGHTLVKKNEILKGKIDSFVVETNVHFPTDINLLYDALRKAIQTITVLYNLIGLPGWRQSKHNQKKIKKLFRQIQKLRHSTSKNPDKIAEKKRKIIEAHQEYIDIANSMLYRIKHDLQKIQEMKINKFENFLEKTKKFIKHTERQIDQIKKRVLEGIKITHDEKIFSVFQEHTEWICKGKAGITQELGVRVCIMEDNFGFILNHLIMQNQTDDKVTLPFVKNAKNLFPCLNSCSFDKGFYTPANKLELAKLIDHAILPKKGKLSAQDKKIEYSEEFIKARRKHSGIESAINALENHGLDRCPDHGVHGFKRYVALAVLARNIQVLGNILQKREKIYKKYKQRQRLRA